ncbi:MAG: hypothetical protein H0T42_12220 [Deltaproteobacteria bacterium]|nr:hypothetical protein [Deltaproteobacteria bacterium]
MGGLAAALVVLPIAAAMMANRVESRAVDPCAPTFDTRALSDRDRGLVARRLLACSDVAHGRITGSAYRAQIAAIDAAWTREPAVVTAPPATQWASSVRDFSTQYTSSSWAATKVLGAPDVFPGHGDNANAWASLDADDRDEWIDVRYAQPMRISAVEVYENFNPGSISRIELITTEGRYITGYEGSPSATGQGGNKLRAEVGCTSAAIVGVRVTLASPMVAGWNELDAIGIVPCAE